jgi:hypothetical protein
LPIEFAAACQGYEEREIESARLLRFSSYRIAESMAGSKAVGPIDRFWPMPGDKPNNPAKEMTKERYEAILKRHKLNIK